MPLWHLIILRCIFTLAVAGLAVSIINSTTFPRQPEWLAWAVMGGLLSLAGGVVAIDLGIRRKQLDVISSVYFGLIVGMFLAYIAQLVIKPLIPASITETNPAWIWIQPCICSWAWCSAIRASACSCRPRTTSAS